MTIDTDAQTTIRIASRFNGPFDSGNGGYSAGLAAAALTDPHSTTEATLRAPIPLEATLRAHPTADGFDIMTDDAENRILIMSLKPATLAQPAITPPSLEAARTAAQTFRAAEDHVLPTCFVCGPARNEGDGLRIFTDWLHPDDNANPFPVVAAPWRPSPDLDADDGLIAPEFLWAALDCPGAFALDAEPILLGRMTTQILTRPAPDAELIALAWKLGAEGRKHHAATALFTQSGDLIAHAQQTWIQINAHAAPKTARA